MFLLAALRAGPAHLSERISIRDELLAVDGAPVNADTLPEMIISTDICNTYVDLDLKTADGSGRKTVRLVRVSRAHLRVAEDLFETLIKLKGQLAKLFPECVGHIDRALECISALAISEFDAREAFVERLMDEGVQQVAPSRFQLSPCSQLALAPAMRVSVFSYGVDGRTHTHVRAHTHIHTNRAVSG